MNKNYIRIILISSICLLMGLYAYNFFIKGELQSKNQKSINGELKERQVVKQNDNGLKKERDFIGLNLKYNDKSIPVLMYHSIDYEKGNELRIPKEIFREQMKYLKDNEYTTLTFDELYKFLVDNKPIPKKSVIITFDDGYKDNYENAYPILKQFGLNATIFVITDTIDKDKNYLTSNELKELDQNGIDIESHTVGHEQLNKLTYEKQLDTLIKSRKSLERILGREVKYIGYPFGKWNNNTLIAVKDAGYSMAFTTVSGWSNKEQGIYTLYRVYISANYNIREFERRLTNINYNINNN